MREILFRAKSIDTNEFVYGYYTLYMSNCGGIYPCILTGIKYGKINPIHIDKETVGQYVGLRDKNNKMIFEGDIVRCYSGCHCQGYYEFDRQVIINFENPETLMEISEVEHIEVIGNIYDNSKLLKGDNNDDL